MIALGAVAERGRIAPLIVFIFVWSTLVYDPGSLIGSGILMSGLLTFLVITVHMGRRRGFGTDVLRYSANNVGNVVLGMALMWFGWVGFISTAVRHYLRIS